MKLFNIINNFKNKYRDIYNSYFYNFIIIKSYLKNLNLNKFFIRNKLKTIEIKKPTKHKFNKNVLIVIHSLSRGGAERQVVKLANLLTKKKYNVEILLTNYKFKHNDKNSYILELNKKIKVNFIKKPKDHLNFLKDLNTIDYKLRDSLSFLTQEDLYLVSELLKYFRNKKINLIHSFLDDTNIIAGISGLISNTTRIILSLRNAAPWRWTYYKSYWKECYRFLSTHKNIKIVCNSKNNALDYEKWLKIKKGSIKITYNIFNFERSRNVKKKKIDINNITFGTLARLAPEKNLFYLLKIFKELKLENSYLKILGKGYLLNRLIKFTKKLGIEDQVRFLPEANNVHKYLSTLDIFILSSYIEGTPNVLLEAQNMKLPIFSTNVGGINECVVKNNTCYFISSRNYKVAAKTIIHTLSKKSFYKRKNFETVIHKLNKFHSNKVYKKIKILYTKPLV